MFAPAVDSVDHTCVRCSKAARQPPKPFTWQDLQDVKTHALEAFKSMPYNAQLPGHPNPLTGEDQRILSIVEGTLTMLQAKGYLKLGPMDRIVVYERFDLDPIDD